MPPCPTCGAETKKSLPLPPRQEAFVNALVAGAPSQAEAYRQAGYSPNGAPNNASRLIRTDTVALRLGAKKASRADKATRWGRKAESAIDRALENMDAVESPSELLQWGVVLQKLANEEKDRSGTDGGISDADLADAARERLLTHWRMIRYVLADPARAERKLLWLSRLLGREQPKLVGEG